MEVVMLSLKDYGHSGHRIAEAVNAFGRHRVRVATRGIPNNGMKADICVETDGSDELRHLLKKADIIHFKGDEPPQQRWFDLSVPAVPWVVSVGGSAFRRGMVRSGIAKAIWPLEAYDIADLRTALTPDLNYPEYVGIYTQQAINASACAYEWKRRRVPVIGHSPSARRKKGTEMLVWACETLRQQGYHFELDIIENVSYDQCVERKRKLSLFVDQVCATGAYGNSGLEAMQYGIPTIAHISDQAREQSDGKWDDLPVIGVANNHTGLYSALKYYLDHPDELEDVSYLTKIWCDRVHSYETVGTMWTELYDNTTN